MTHEAAHILSVAIVVILTALVFFGLGIIAERDRAKREGLKVAARKAAEEQAAFDRIMKAVDEDSKNEQEITVIDTKARSVRFERYAGPALNARGGGVA